LDVTRERAEEGLTGVASAGPLGVDESLAGRVLAKAGPRVLDEATRRSKELVLEQLFLADPID
jgi:hypothetical protein